MRISINSIEIDFNNLVKHIIEFNQFNRNYHFEVYQYKNECNDFYIGTVDSLDNFICQYKFVISDAFDYLIKLSDKLFKETNKSAWFAIDLMNEDMNIYKVELKNN